MGLIGILAGLSKTAGAGGSFREAAEVLLGNRAEEARLENKEFSEVLEQFGKEFAVARTGWFDRLVDALNRLPRPVLALGTLSLFGFSMVAPQQFALRMEGLGLVPEPLWWLMGAIVSFYFGARELHYRREGAPVERLRTGGDPAGDATALRPVPVAGPTGNAAFDEWRAGQGQ
jgi:hypothetical protein